MFMDFNFWYTLILLIVMSLFLVREWFEAEIVIFSVLMLLIVGNVITIKQAFLGFSNEGMLTVALLFVIAAAMDNTGVMSQLNRIMYGNPKSSVPKILTRLLIPIAALSAFLNNTPIVAMMIPSIKSWADKTHISASKLYIPLSYAAILGGMCTLIGSSTNLIIYGLMIDFGIEGLGLFELSLIGVPVALVGIIYMITIGHKLLPDRKEPIISLGENTREFVIELKVTENYQNIGKTIEEAGLRHLKGLFLFEIHRNNRIIAPASPRERINVDDRLFFTGIPKTILEIQKTPGLQLIKDSTFDLKQYDSSEIKPYEAVISPSSPLIGKSVRASNFRGKYGAVIIAIHRNAMRVNKKIGDIILNPGDTLLLLANTEFKKKWYHSDDFYLISETDLVPSKPHRHLFIALGTFLSMMLLVIFNVLSILAAAGLAAVILIFSKTISPVEARNAVNIKVLIIIASAFGIAEAMKESGVANFLAEQIVYLGSIYGILGVLIGIFIITGLYTNFITNNAAAAILFPIVYSVAISSGISPRPLMIALAIAASASFSTPISYQTNLMVYGPGGYKFSDFGRIGLPMQFITAIVSIILIDFYYF
jgi:di/tricarboxylate transporter